MGSPTQGWSLGRAREDRAVTGCGERHGWPHTGSKRKWATEKPSGTWGLCYWSCWIASSLRAVWRMLPTEEAVFWLVLPVGIFHHQSLSWLTEGISSLGTQVGLSSRVPWDSVQSPEAPCVDTWSLVFHHRLFTVSYERSC